MEQELRINNLEFFVRIGLEPWERVIRRKVVLNVSFFTRKIVDYAEVKTFIASFIADEDYSYIEQLANLVFQRLKARFSVEKIKLEAMKPEALYQSCPSVILCG